MTPRGEPIFIRFLRAVTLLAVGGALIPAPAVAANIKRCGAVAATTEGVPTREKVIARGVTCRFARATVRGSNRGRPPRGWSCSGSGEGVLCVRGSQADLKAAQRDLGSRAFVRGDLTT